MREKQLNVTIPKELDQQLERFCIDEDIKKKEAVKQALEIFFIWADRIKKGEIS